MGQEQVTVQASWHRGNNGSHVFAGPELLQKLEAAPGDLVTIKDARFFMGDLRGTHGVIQPAQADMSLGDSLGVPAALLAAGQLNPKRPVMVRRVL